MSSEDILERSLAREMGRCIRDFDLIESGDKILVGVSGGKDSYTLLHLLERARRRSPVSFELLAVHLDQGQPGYDGRPLSRFLEDSGIPFRVVVEDTYSIVKERVPQGRTYCALCSRLRRGVLYNLAEDLGCHKIALGHHRDDAIETLLLNLMFSGSLGAMPAKLQSQDGRNCVIRPLMYCSEDRISRFAAQQSFPILPCNLCGSQEHLRRKRVKELLRSLEHEIPQIRESMLAALGNVRATHLLDQELLSGLAMQSDNLPKRLSFRSLPVLTEGRSESESTKTMIR
ncbi:MAG: tRNA 2-thiocytidine(32) synthetase TtcA [Myxococcota bacterium]